MHEMLVWLFFHDTFIRQLFWYKKETSFLKKFLERKNIDKRKNIIFKIAKEYSNSSYISFYFRFPDCFQSYFLLEKDRGRYIIIRRSFLKLKKVKSLMYIFLISFCIKLMSITMIHHFLYLMIVILFIIM